MPNGGSDCCGTCWFNQKNKGEPGYEHAHDPDPDVCIIRDLVIENPFYTYCINHPHHNPEKLDFPIGSVYVDAEEGRKLWVESSDTEEIRQGLLKLLKEITEIPEDEYPSGIYRDEVVIRQVGVFKEKRAITDLQRIAAFNPKAASVGAFGRTRQYTVELAQWALNKIQADGAGSKE